MNNSGIKKHAQPLERPYSRQLNSSQPIRDLNCQPIGGNRRELGNDVFVSSKPKAENNISFGQKLRIAAANLAKNFGS